MSRSTIYKIENSGLLVHHEDFSNSWLGAMLIWSDMSERYLGVDRGEAAGAMLIDKSFAGKVWDLPEDPRMTRRDRIVLLVTFDNSLVRRSEFPELCEALRSYHAELPPVDQGCHARLWADSIERIPPDAIGCGWQMTSVSANPWRVRTGDDDDRPYDINKDAKHFWLFDAIQD